jgi:CheY-like chemotaxis protein
MTDVQMPGMSGYELANLARAGYAELHVVIMSGNDPGDRPGFKFVRKPFSQDHLHEIVGPLVRTQ